MYPYNDDRLQQIMGAAASLPPSTYSQQYAADPQRAQAMMQRFTGNMLLPQDGILLPEEPATGVESAPQYATDDTSFDALDVAKTILGTPFALLRAGREGLEDVLGHPNAQRRQAADAYIAQMQPYMEQQQKMQLLQSSLRPEQAAALGMLPVPSPLASQPVTGMPTGGQPNAEPAGSRKTGVAQWLKNLTRDDRAQKVAQIQAYLRQQAFDLKRRDAEAGIGAKESMTRLHQSQTEGSDWKNLMGYKYDDAINMGTLGEKRANIAQSYAGAGASNAAAAKYDAERGGVMEERERKGLYFRDVDYPGGVAENERKGRFFEDVTYPAGLQANRQQKDAGVRANQGFSVWEQVQADEQKRKEQETASVIRRNDALTEQRTSGRQPSAADWDARDLAIRDAYLRATAPKTEGGEGRDRAEAAAALDIPLKDSDTFGFDYKVPDWDEFRARRARLHASSDQRTSSTGAPMSQGISPSHPKFDQFYNRVKNHPEAAGLSPAEIQAEALKLMAIEGVQ